MEFSAVSQSHKVKRTLWGSYFQDYYFWDSYFRDSHFRDSHFRDSHFRDSYFRDSYFRDSYFRDSYFSAPISTCAFLRFLISLMRLARISPR
ncbi:pentapeptide repeat-containing protein [Methanosarcina vacuolata]|uniref:pentapeptide repeat-containing protein n=1 Tax=Methanosarcina vacuolata TaxID=2215 RepID=UPI00373AEF6C